MLVTAQPVKQSERTFTIEGVTPAMPTSTLISAELIKTISEIVKHDPDCASHIGWKLTMPGAGSVRNFAMQSQGRLDEFGRSGNLFQLLWGEVSISRWREQYVCVGIAEWTCIAINKALLLPGQAASRLRSFIEYAGPVSCAAFPHMGTGLRLAQGHSRARRDPHYKPMLAYVEGTKVLHPLVECDFVLDWWYSLDPARPRVFNSQADFDAYGAGSSAPPPASLLP